MPNEEDGAVDNDEHIFEKIINREAPADVVYEDEQVLAFRNIRPLAPVHVLVVPKKKIKWLQDAKDEDQDILGALLMGAKKVAEKENLVNGYRIAINNGQHASQAIYHLHVHVMGGEQMSKLRSAMDKNEEDGALRETYARVDNDENIFEKIINSEAPADVVYEDEQVLAFRDIMPLTPVHVLVVPKKTIKSLQDAKDEDKDILGALLLGAKKVAEKENLVNGYRIVINNGQHASQAIYHLHVHVMGGEQMLKLRSAMDKN